MDRKLKVILFTLFLEMISFGIIIPIMPFIVKAYWVSDFYVWLSYSIYAIWSFIWWLYFWKLSDKFWRKKVLIITMLIHIFWYLLFSFSLNIYLFLIARFIIWIWASWISVAQAYIADISSNEDRVKNMGYMWAAFWLWFLFWPVFGWLLTSISQNLNFIWWIAWIILLINLILVKILMIDSTVHKNIQEDIFKEKNIIKKLKNYNKSILVIFFISFIAAFWFSWMQSTFALILESRFSQNATQIWLFLGFIWISSILYQVLWISIVRKRLSEKQMILMWLFLLAVSFILFWYNSLYLLIFLIIPFFPIWYWSVNPAVWSLLAKLWTKNIWKLMGYNTSSVSFWNILWPLICWYLYVIDWKFAYLLSFFLFLVWFFICYKLLKENY